MQIFLSVQDRSLIVGDAKTGAAVYNIDKTVKLADVVVNKADVEKRAKEEVCVDPAGTRLSDAGNASHSKRSAALGSRNRTLSFDPASSEGGRRTHSPE